MQFFKLESASESLGESVKTQTTGLQPSEHVIQQVQGGAGEHAFLTGFQALPMLHPRKGKQVLCLGGICKNERLMNKSLLRDLT